MLREDETASVLLSCYYLALLCLTEKAPEFDVEGLVIRCKLGFLFEVEHLDRLGI